MPRPEKPHVRREIRLDKALDEQAKALRLEGETLTDQIEDGLRRHVAARKRAQNPKD